MNSNYVIDVIEREAKIARHYRVENGAVNIADEASSNVEDAKSMVNELIELLILSRSELSGLPHSPGYSFTHLAKIDSLLLRVRGAA